MVRGLAACYFGVMAKPSFADIIGHPIPEISIVDVGAMFTGEDRYSRLVETGLATVSGFEPHAEAFAKLPARRGYRYHQLCLGNGCTRVPTGPGGHRC